MPCCDDLARRHLRVSHQRARGRERIDAARADRHDAIVRLDHVTVAADGEQRVLVADDQQRLEATQHAVAAPVLGQLDNGLGQVFAVALELLLELLEEREGIGRRAGETGDELAVAQTAHLLRRGLRHRLAHRHLPVAADGDLPIAADGEDGRCVKHGHFF